MQHLQMRGGEAVAGWGRRRCGAVFPSRRSKPHYPDARARASRKGPLVAANWHRQECRLPPRPLKTVERRPFNPRGENGSPERSVHPNSGLPEFGINKVIEVG